MPDEHCSCSCCALWAAPLFQVLNRLLDKVLDENGGQTAEEQAAAAEELRRHAAELRDLTKQT